MLSTSVPDNYTPCSNEIVIGSSYWLPFGALKNVIPIIGSRIPKILVIIYFRNGGMNLCCTVVTRI